jgi:hypothetical protein
MVYFIWSYFPKGWEFKQRCGDLQEEKMLDVELFQYAGMT